MSPSVSMYVEATRSTSAGGGVSATKRRTSFVAMKRAGEGWRVRIARTRSPSSRPPPAAVLSRWHDEVRPGGEPVVEVEERRWMARTGADEVGKASQRVRADDITLVGRDVPADVALPGEDVEVVEPEVDHDLRELALALDRAEGLRGLELRGDPERPLLGRIRLHHLRARHPAVLELLPELRIGSWIFAQRLGDRHAE